MVFTQTGRGKFRDTAFQVEHHRKIRAGISACRYFYLFYRVTLHIDQARQKVKCSPKSVSSLDVSLRRKESVLTTYR